MKSRKWFWGIFFLAAAVLIVVNQFLYMPISIGKLIATVFLAAIFIDGISTRNFFNIFVPASIIFVLWSSSGWLGFSRHLSFWPMIPAAILLAIGFSIIFPRRGGNSHFGSSSNYERRSHNRGENNGEDGRFHGEENRQFTSGNEEESNVRCDVSFGAKSHYLYTQSLESGNFNCSFGELKVYFDQARLSPNGAQVQVDCSFGSTELYIPREWNVVNNLSSSLGAMNENYRGAQGTGPALVLTGGVSLGNIQIFYV